MPQIILNEKLIFVFEPSGKKIRLVITEADEELVCRKETLKNLQCFLAEEQAHLFKGRLQLFKSGDEIDVKVKNEIVGKISVQNFQHALN
ncbi:MAG: hypothetical protein EOO87_09055 [Pedobacter sp.]|nr:MAG: hypothetical protein EOO87_09055 [Pedobacter sp.]